MTCPNNVCGTGIVPGPKPGDPDNNIALTATVAYGGIDVKWAYPASNPHAVAHTLLYRGTTNNRSAALQIAVVAGNLFYDKIAEIGTYFYWIQVVSVNGTVGDFIGPASATTRARSQDTVEDITGQIDNGVLGIALRQDIARIALNYTELKDEIRNRIVGDTALSAAFADLDAGLVEAVSLVNTEITTRREGDSALAQQMSVIAAANKANASAIVDEKTARVTADAAITRDYRAVLAATEGNAAAIQTVESSKIGYAALSGTSSPFDGDGVTVVYSATKYPSALFPEYATNRNRIIDKTGVAEWNATPAGIAKPVVWLVGLPLATAVKTVQVTGPEGQIASVEQGFIAQKDLNGNFKAQYTAKVNVNGLIGGFGIYNDGKVVEAGFDVDRFWIGRTPANKRKPFIIENDTTYIDSAVIRDGSIDNAKIGVAAIRQANIGIAEIDTLRIAGNAVSIALWSNGFQSAQVSFTVPPGEVWESVTTVNYSGNASYGSGNSYTPTVGIYTLSGVNEFAVPFSYFRNYNGGGDDEYSYQIFVQVPVTRTVTQSHGPGTHTISASYRLTWNQHGVGTESSVALNTLVKKR